MHTLISRIQTKTQATRKNQKLIQKLNQLKSIAMFILSSLRRRTNKNCNAPILQKMKKIKQYEGSHPLLLFRRLVYAKWNLCSLPLLSALQIRQAKVEFQRKIESFFTCFFQLQSSPQIKNHHISTQEKAQRRLGKNVPFDWVCS